MELNLYKENSCGLVTRMVASKPNLYQFEIGFRVWNKLGAKFGFWNPNIQINFDNPCLEVGQYICK